MQIERERVRENASWKKKVSSFIVVLVNLLTSARWDTTKIILRAQTNIYIYIWYIGEYVYNYTYRHIFANHKRWYQDSDSARLQYHYNFGVRCLLNIERGNDAHDKNCQHIFNILFFLVFADSSLSPWLSPSTPNSFLLIYLIEVICLILCENFFFFSHSFSLSLFLCCCSLRWTTISMNF